MASRTVPDRWRTELVDQGFVILRGFLPLPLLDGVQRELEGWVDRQAQDLFAAGTVPSVFADEPFATRLLRLHQASGGRAATFIREDLHLPGMYPLFFHPPLLDLVTEMLGPEIQLYPNYTARPKLPLDAATEVLWHQDAGYTAGGLHGHDPAAGKLVVDDLRMVNVWTPLVPARPENGCMQFIPRSHRGGIVPHLQKAYYLEIDPAYLDPVRDRAVDIIMDPGDVVLFSNQLFHRGLPNQATSIRWSCDWRYQDATQSTLRNERGHLARSSASPARVVQSAADWAARSFV